MCGLGLSRSTGARHHEGHITITSQASVTCQVALRLTSWLRKQGFRVLGFKGLGFKIYGHEAN